MTAGGGEAVGRADVGGGVVEPGGSGPAAVGGVEGALRCGFVAAGAGPSMGAVLGTGLGAGGVGTGGASRGVVEGGDVVASEGVGAETGAGGGMGTTGVVVKGTGTGAGTISEAATGAVVVSGLSVDTAGASPSLICNVSNLRFEL